MAKNLEKFEALVEAFSSFPTVGKKSATRFAYHLIFKDSFLGLKLSNAIEDALSSITKCTQCGGMSESEICHICTNEYRDHTKLCIVQSPSDIILLEENNIFNGIYFILEEIESLEFEKLKKLVQKGIKEIIFALPHNISNDALILYIEDKLKDYDLKFTKIAQGVPSGVSLENVDMVSLSKAIEGRVKI